MASWMVRSFCDQLDEVKADGALGLTDARYVLDKYPDGARAFHRFRDGAPLHPSSVASVIPAKAGTQCRPLNDGPRLR